MPTGTPTNLVGQRFGKWLVLGRGTTRKKHTRYLCRCDCGQEREVFTALLVRGRSTNCGCSRKDTKPSLTHGQSRTRLYHVWLAMKQRCLVSTHRMFVHYGGRGITICADWLKFEGFEQWARASGYEENLTIDRIDVNGNYEPSNCRWATRLEQSRNKRKQHYLTYKGETRTISEWAEILGMNYGTFSSRVYKGWPLELVFNPVVGKYRNGRCKS